jgi:AAA family ATP:ADP antiporter
VNYFLEGAIVKFMTEEKTSVLVKIRKVIWPIEVGELKKFLPMGAMMFCILFNYSMLRSIKDGFVVTNIGPEAISFLKTYIVLPSAVLAILIYSKLCNMMSKQSVFYTITGFFVAYLAVFALFLYPNADALHFDDEYIGMLADSYPQFKWFIKIVGKWVYAVFYAMSELWGSMMLSLLFWQFANQITKTDEAKRFYSTFGIVGNCGLVLTGYVLGASLDEGSAGGSAIGFEQVILTTVLGGLLIMFLYWWMDKNVLTDPRFYSNNERQSKKAKTKLSLGESFKLIFSSKYLGLIAALVLCYGISMNLIEGMWKAKAKELYPTAAAYTAFMGTFQMLQGFGAIFFMIIGSNILRKSSWGFAAMFTPIMILITGLAFCCFIFFDNTVGLYISGVLASTPLSLAVAIGTMQNVLSKATKYSLFDSTKEMAYIPLEDELKTKGKAAVDVVGGRLGKSGGGIIQSTFFILLPSYSFSDATPYFAVVFFAMVIIWTFAVKALNKEYNNQMMGHAY